MAKFLLSIRPYSYGKFSKIVFEHWSSLNQKYLELDVPKSYLIAKLLYEKLSSYNLKALSISIHIDIDDKNVIKKFQKYEKIIKLFEPMYIFSSVKIKNESERAKGYPLLKELGDFAKDLNVFISIETHPFYNTNADRGMETMQNINHPNVKLNFDTANIYFYNQNIDGVEELKKILPWIGSLHIKDCNLNYHEWYFPAIGDGKVNYPELIKVLNNLDKTIPLTIEIEGIKGEIINLEQAKNRVEKSVEYLKKLINF